MMRIGAWASFGLDEPVRWWSGRTSRLAPSQARFRDFTDGRDGLSDPRSGFGLDRSLQHVPPKRMEARKQNNRLWRVAPRAERKSIAVPGFENRAEGAPPRRARDTRTGLRFTHLKPTTIWATST